MNPPTPTTLSEKLQLVADAVLIAIPYRENHRISPSLQKSVLYVLLAYEGKAVSVRTVSDRAAIGHSTALHALVALRREGVIRASRFGPNKTRTYAIDFARLDRTRSYRPLVGTSGQAGQEVKRLKAENLLREGAR